jgi:hypothetical protein
MTTRSSTIAVAVLALAGVLGACGGGGGSGGSEGESAEGGGSEELSAWVECMAGEGLELPEPSQDADGNYIIVGDGVNIGGESRISFGEYSEEEFQAGTEVCGGPPIRSGMSQETLQEEEERVLAYSECMRENGVADFPDPDWADDESDGMFTPWPQEQMEEVQADPDFETADEACRDLVLPPGAEPVDDDEGEEEDGGGAGNVEDDDGTESSEAGEGSGG